MGLDEVAKLSIIIVNYNTKDYLEECLESIRSQGYGFGVETIVVDNNSCDGSREMLRSRFPEVRLVENCENEGFARACNRGITAARGFYILLLNSDARLSEGALTRLSGFLDRTPGVGVVSGRLVYPDYFDQGVARKFPSPINALFGRRSLMTKLFPNNRFSRKYMLSRNHDSGEPFAVDWVSGACMMIRRQVIEEIGLLDEGFFMYWEDADFCFRAKERGWKVFCVPDAIVVHHEGKSAGRRDGRLIVEFNRSAYRYYRKHHVSSSITAMNFVALLGLTLRTVVLLGANMLKRKGAAEDAAVKAEGEAR
jgi:N-acetylglucosaminyl-diphospho-decaprenol L-rhamnosyltransferase